MSGQNSACIPLLVLGECPPPDMETWVAGPGISWGIARVPETQDLQKALDTALSESDTLILLGGFQGEGLPPLAMLMEMLAQSLLIEESQLALRMIGQAGEAGSCAVLRAGDIRVYACGAAETPWEEVLDEIQGYAASSPGSSPANAWLLPIKPAQNAQAQKTRAAKTPRMAARLSSAAKPPLIPKPLLVVLVAAMLAFCLGAGYLIYYAADSGLQDARGRAVQALYSDEAAQDTDRGGDGTFRQFEALRALNSDCVGWLSIPGAQVDLPVMQGSDDAYYLSHDVQKNKSRFGALFLSTHNIIARSGQSPNLSIFGHNTKNGSMFGKLHRFRDLSFYRQNAVFRFDTIYTRRQWVVFAVFITNANPVQDYGTVFEWREQSSAAPGNITAFVASLKRRSVIDTGVDVRPGDLLLSLTTCTYEIKDARLVVFARALRPGEAPPDTARARENPAPLYPAAWYVTYGGEKPAPG